MLPIHRFAVVLSSEVLEAVRIPMLRQRGIFSTKNNRHKNVTTPTVSEIFSNGFRQSGFINYGYDFSQKPHNESFLKNLPLGTSSREPRFQQ